MILILCDFTWQSAAAREQRTACATDFDRVIGKRFLFPCVTDPPCNPFSSSPTQSAKCYDIQSTDILSILGGMSIVACFSIKIPFKLECARKMDFISVDYQISMRTKVQEYCESAMARVCRYI